MVLIRVRATGQIEDTENDSSASELRTRGAPAGPAGYAMRGVQNGMSSSKSSTFFFAAAAGAGLAPALAPSRRAPPSRAAPAAGTRELGVPAAAGIARAADQLHAIGDDLGRILFHAVLVGVLARLQAAFDVDRAALLQVFARDLGLASEQHDAVPLRALLLLAALVLPLLARRDVEVGDGFAAGGIARFRVAAEVAEQDHLVDGGHLMFLPSSSS